MDKALFGIPNMDVYIVLGILIFFIVLETAGGYWSKSKRNGSDWIQEFGGFLLLSLGTKPLIILMVLGLGNLIMPQMAGSLSNMSIVLAVILYLLIDDVLQYWYHRSAHEYEFLWKLHRPHHQAEEMGFFVSYRNAALYYLIMPNIWWVGLCTFFGLAYGVAIGLILKQAIIISSHSTISYDKFLYKYKFLNPLVYLWEHIFITPAFHHAHHAKSKVDGIGDPNRNFGNMFSLWDQIFGTAVFTRQFPQSYGLMHNTNDSWNASMFYPINTSQDQSSEISRGYVKEDTSSLDAITVQLKEGESYLWCACGKSKGQPFCDGSHHGSKVTPVRFVAQKTTEVKLCNCKKTKAGPFCDNTHLDFMKTN